MSAWLRAAVVALVLILPADGWAWGRPVTVAAYYYYPVPVTFTPVYRAYYVLPGIPVEVCPPPLAAPRQGNYANPTPAPPSTRQPPRVTESESTSTGTGPTRFVAEKRNTDRYRVGFWNVSNRDVTLRIDGRTHTLARGRSLTVNLGRQFTWQEVGADPQAEEIPAARSSMEILIRR
jgi:hypothetical protein